MRVNVIMLIICLVVIANSLIAQNTEWKFVDPGGNGWSASVIVHPASGYLYYSSDMTRSLLRSKDEGGSWEPISNPVTGTAFGIVGDPTNSNIIYINQKSENKEKTGIWKSEDSGDTWNLVFKSSLFGTSRGQSGLIDPDNSENIYWTNKSNGVLWSDDAGNSWEAINVGLPTSLIKQERHLNALEMEFYNNEDNRLIYYPTNIGLYKYSKRVNRWIKLNDYNCTQVAVCEDSILYAAYPDKGLFKSSDEGKTWVELTNGLKNHKPLRVLASRNNPDIVYVSVVNDKGVYGSTDGGKTFILLTHYKHNKDFNWPMNYRQQESVSGMTMFIDPNDPLKLYMDYNKKTVDGGKTWVHYGTKELKTDRWSGTGMALLTEYRVAFDPNRSGYVWLGFSDTGLSLSEDNGESIINLPSYHRGEVNQAAGFRDRLVNTSGSCPSIEIDPELSTTIYAALTGKQSTNRASVGGIMIKSVDGGWNWKAIYTKNGLPDGIIRSIKIDPKTPKYNRTLYVASYSNGVYKSEDDGNTFYSITNDELFGGNKRIMDLSISKTNTNVLYLGVGGSKGIRPISGGSNVYPKVKVGMYGGVYKTIDGGINWNKCNKNIELPSVQDLHISPVNENIVYAAVFSESFLNKNDDNKYSLGGLYKTVDGGVNWNIIFDAPIDENYGEGEVIGVVVNPIAPEIIYTVVQNFGVFGTIDEGNNWYKVGQKSMDRMQRNYHSININPHNTAEIWVAHFGSSFSKITDTIAQKYLANKMLDTNLVMNSDFQEIDSNTDFARYWKFNQPPAPIGEENVISIEKNIKKNKGNSIHFKLTDAYTNAPSPYLADKEQRKLQDEGVISIDSAWMEEYENTGETRSWITQKIDPYFVSLAKGKNVKIEMDIFIKERNLQTWYMRACESGEIERYPPQLYLTEVRDYNINWLVAETFIEDIELPDEEIKGKWIHVSSEGFVSEKALGLNIVVTGVGMYSNAMDIYIDNVSLKVIK